MYLGEPRVRTLVGCELVDEPARQSIKICSLILTHTDCNAAYMALVVTPNTLPARLASSRWMGMACRELIPGFVDRGGLLLDLRKSAPER